MATKNGKENISKTDGYEYIFSDWVYQVPGFILIVGGFGALAAMALL